MTGKANAPRLERCAEPSEGRVEVLVGARRNAAKASATPRTRSRGTAPLRKRPGLPWALAQANPSLRDACATAVRTRTVIVEKESD